VRCLHVTLAVAVAVRACAVWDFGTNKQVITTMLNSYLAPDAEEPELEGEGADDEEAWEAAMVAHQCKSRAKQCQAVFWPAFAAAHPAHQASIMQCVWPRFGGAEGGEDDVHILLPSPCACVWTGRFHRLYKSFSALLRTTAASRPQLK